VTVRRTLLTLLTALAAVGLWLNAPAAEALPAPQAAPCAGVWVVVDFGSLGGASTSCATTFSTGTAALRAGFSPTLDNGMVIKINGIPATVNVQDHYWSYWHATLRADGSYSSWTYSGLGSNAYRPTAGNADGWRYQALSDGYVAPGVAPPTKVAAAPATTAPAPTAAKPATTKTVATAPTTAQTAQSAPDATASPATPTPEASASDAPTAVATPADVTDTDASPSAGTTRASAKASMLGGLAVIAVLVVASICLAVWRKRRGRVG
jgi:hypothetical protein